MLKQARGRLMWIAGIHEIIDVYPVHVTKLATESLTLVQLSLCVVGRRITHTADAISPPQMLEPVLSYVVQQPICYAIQAIKGHVL